MILNQHQTSKHLLLGLALLELAMLSFWKGGLGPRISSIALLLSGIIFGFGFLYYCLDRKLDYSRVKWIQTRSKSYMQLGIGLALLGLILSGYFLSQELATLPITDFRKTTGSDVIPQIGIMVERFLNGEFPYQWISKWAFRHTLYPTYLPMTWLPYIIPDLMGIDYRVFAFGVLVTVIGWMIWRVRESDPSIVSMIVTYALPFLFLTAIILFDSEGNFKYSVETLIVAFYLILAFALLRRSWVMIAIALIICLLSRYSVVLWLPVLVLVVWSERGFPQIFKIGLLTLVGMLVIYGPFLLEDPMIFINGYDYHTDAAIQSWKVRTWQPEGALPFNIYKGLGFCWVAVEYFEGDLAQQVGTYQTVHLIVTIGITLLLCGLYWRLKDRIDSRLFLLVSLKLYLVVFYNFIQIPFGYLYFVPLLLSLPMLALLYSRRLDTLRHKKSDNHWDHRFDS